MTRSILIVDDEVAVALSLGMAFESSGWEVHQLRSAEEALRTLSERSYHALLIDKNLPGLTGVDLIRELRRAGANPVMLIMTGFASPDSALQALHLGVDGYLEKPFDDIFAVVERVDRLVSFKTRPRSQPLTHANTHFKRATEQLQAAAHPTPSTRCLVVAPDRDAASELANLARQVAEEVVQTAAPDEARSRMQEQPSHLVIVDARLGWETLEELVRSIKKPGAGPGVVVVGDTDPPLRVITRLIENGVHSVLRRPINRDELLDRLLAERRLTQGAKPSRSVTEERIA